MSLTTSPLLRPLHQLQFLKCPRFSSKSHLRPRRFHSLTQRTIPAISAVAVESVFILYLSFSLHFIKLIGYDWYFSLEPNWIIIWYHQSLTFQLFFSLKYLELFCSSGTIVSHDFLIPVVRIVIDFSFRSCVHNRINRLKQTSLLALYVMNHW